MQSNNQQCPAAGGDLPRFLEVLLMLGIVLIPLAAQWKVGPVHVTTTQIFFSLVLLGWVALRGLPGLVREIRPQGSLRWLEWGMLAFVLAGAASVWAAQNRTLAIKELVQIVFCIAIYAYVRSNALRTFGIDRYCRWIVWVAGAAALLGVVQYFMSPPTTFTIVLGRTRPYLTFGDPNNFAAYLAGLLPLSLAVVAQRPRRWGYMAAVTLVVFCLICTCSRSAWLSAIVGSLVLLLIRRREMLVPMAMLLAIAVVGSVLFAYDVRHQGTDRGLAIKKMPKSAETGETAWGQDAEAAATADEAVEATPILRRNTDSFRKDLVRLGLTMFRTNPILGVGLGNSGDVMPYYFERAQVSEGFQMDYQAKGQEMTIHSMPLQLLTELGLASMTVLVVIGGMIWMFVQGCRRGRPRDAALLAGLIGACGAILVATCFGWLFTRGLSEIFFILLGLAAAQARKTPARELAPATVVEDAAYAAANRT